MAKKSNRRDGAQSAVPKQRNRPPAGDPYDDYSTPAQGRTIRSKRKKKARMVSPLWAKITLTFGAVLMLVSIAGVVGIKTVVDKVNNSIEVVDVLGPTNSDGSKAKPDGTELKGAINMLLLGIDVRSSWTDKNATLADTIMILHIPATHDQAYLMSIPRDTRVNIPAVGNWRESPDKINAAFMRGATSEKSWAGGLKHMGKTVTALTGIKFNAGAVIDFGGFEKIINALGTVHICVDVETRSVHHFMVNGKPKYISVKPEDIVRRGLKSSQYVHKKGCRDMEAWEALDFSRQRYGLSGTDYARQRHQQQLIKAMVAKATSAGVLTDFSKLNKLISAAGKSMLMSLQGAQPVDFLFTMKDMASADISPLKTNAGDYNPVKVGNQEYEQLSQTSLEMFAAVRDGTLTQYVAENPEVINNEK